MSKPAHHQVNVIQITEIKPHGNAERLEIVPIEGFQAVVAKGQFKVGDLAYYVPPDSIVPDRAEYSFLWGDATFEGGTPIKKRRIGAKKLRGEWSEGLLMPVRRWVPGSPFGAVDGEDNQVFEVACGDDVASILGIEHYNPPEPGESTAAGSNEGNAKKWRLPRTYGGWKQLILSWLRGERREGGISLPTYDVDNFKKYQNTFQAGEQVIVTEKIHGSNARYCYKPGLFGMEGKMYAGSRNLWKAPGSTCAWRRALNHNAWIEKWCREHPGYALFGEITPTQKGFDYGSKEGKSGEVPYIKFFVFDVRKPDGKWAERNELDGLFNAPGIALWFGEVSVPFLYAGPFDLKEIQTLVDGKTTVPGANHIREGIVIKSVPERTVSHLGRAQLKLVSNAYLEKSLKEAA